MLFNNSVQTTFEFMHTFKKLSFIGFLLLFTTLAYAQPQPKKAVVDKIIGIVGDRIILNSDIRNGIEDARRQGQTIPAGAECMMMEQALVSKVLMLQAEKDSLPVSEEDVEAALDNQVRQFVRQLGSVQSLEEAAGKTVYQIKDDARPSMKERLLAEAMQKKIVEGVKITPTEVKAFFDRIPKDSLPYFESELEVGKIVVMPKASKDIEDYIVAEMMNYKRQIEAKTVTFDQMAQRYSEDPGSKDRGGRYEINRNEKSWDPDFLGAAFRLKNGEISNPVRSERFGFFLIKMIDKRGDDANVQMILRIPPITETEIGIAKAKLDTVRSRIIAGTIGFNDAAMRYSEDDVIKFQGPFELGRDGAPYVRIDDLDKEMVAALRKMKVGEFSQPVAFTNEQGKKGVRIIYLKSRTEPHVMNMRDDYSKIADQALEVKKAETLDKWLKAKIPTYYIMLDAEIEAECPSLKRFATEEEKAF